MLFCSLPHLTHAQDAIPWRHHGPVIKPGDNVSNDFQNGTSGSEPPYIHRLLDPSDRENAWYTVSPGGIYHTGDLGLTMRRLPHTGMGSLTITRLAVAHDEPNILIAITGDSWTGDDLERRWNVSFPGDGVYRSDDRGETWRSLNLSMRTPDLRYLEDVLVSADGETILVASHSRVMRSVNGGQSWRQVLQLPPKTNPTTETTGVRTSLHAHPENLNHAFVVAWRDAPWVSSEGREYSVRTQTIHQTSDGGATWTMPSRLNGSHLQEAWDIAFAYPQPGVIWALRYAWIPGVGRENNLFRSEDWGQSWTELDVGWEERVISAVPYQTRLRTHPLNADSLYFGWSRSRHSSLAIYRDGSLHPVVAPQRVSWANRTELLLPAPEKFEGFRRVEWETPRTSRVSWVNPENANKPPPWLAHGHNVAPISNLRLVDVCQLAPVPGRAPRWAALARNTKGEFRLLISPDTSASHGDVHVGGWIIPRGQTSGDPNVSVGWDTNGIGQRIYCHPTDPTQVMGLGYQFQYIQGESGRWGQWDELTAQHWKDFRVDDGVTRPSPIEYGVISMSVSEENSEVMVAIGGNDPVYGQTLRSTDFGHTWRVVNRKKRTSYRLHLHQASDSLILADDSWSEDGGRTWTSTYNSGELGFFSNPSVNAPPVRITSHAANDSTIWSCAEQGLAEITYSKINGRIRRWTEVKTYARDYGGCHDLFIFPDNPRHFWMGTDYAQLCHSQIIV